MGPRALRWSQYALLLKKPFIYGAISHVERTRILNAFKHNPQVTPALIRSSTPPATPGDFGSRHLQTGLQIVATLLEDGDTWEFFQVNFVMG